MLKVIEVHPESPLFGHVRPGYSLVSVNDRPIEDEVDFRFHSTDERVSIRFTDTSGRELDFDFEEFTAGELGLTLDDHRIQTCKNNCIFCFVIQQPKGMRRMLYIKDEDYRLSFTHGNFITLSNTTEKDLARIVEQRLSPLYISVHATDDKLRRCMLRNEKLAPILPRIKYLVENGITVHSQVVLCPTINDGEALEKTIEDLGGLYPGVKSLAVVPVGLTKYREKLAKLKTYTPEEAGEIIDQIESIQTRNLKQHGSRFLWPADEFYVLAERPFPRRSVYEEMPQFENGIGMAREFITMFNRRRSGLKSLKSDKRIMMLTGKSAHPFLSREIIPFLTDELGLAIDLHPVQNRFWGGTVTVSGLLTGQDLLRHARSHKSEFDLLVLPPNCLNNDNLFLDNLSLEQFSKVLGRPVVVGQYDLAATIKEVCS